MSDIACPLSCGQCCAYWRDVPELSVYAVAHRNADLCPNEGPDSCLLPRAERPSACTDYLCGVAEAVVKGAIAADHGIYLKERCYDEVPARAKP